MTERDLSAALVLSAVLIVRVKLSGMLGISPYTARYGTTSRTMSRHPPTPKMPPQPASSGHCSELNRYVVATWMWLPVLVSATFVQAGLIGALMRQLLQAAFLDDALPLNKAWVAYQIVWDICYPLALYYPSSITLLPLDKEEAPAYNERKSPFQYHVVLRGSTIGEFGLTLILAGFIGGLLPWLSAYYRDYRLVGAAVFSASLVLVALVAARCTWKRMLPAE